METGGTVCPATYRNPRVDVPAYCILCISALQLFTAKAMQAIMGEAEMAYS